MPLLEVKKLQAVGSKRALVRKRQHIGKMSMACSFNAMALDAKATTEARAWAEGELTDGLKTTKRRRAMTT